MLYFTERASSVVGRAKQRRERTYLRLAKKKPIGADAWLFDARRCEEESLLEERYLKGELRVESAQPKVREKQAICDFSRRRIGRFHG